MNGVVPKIQEEDMTICPVTGQKHIPDWNTLYVQNNGYGHTDTVNLKCKNCRQNGCLGLTWDLLGKLTW